MHRKRGKTMPSNNSKYSQEMREQTAEYIMRSKKSATSVAEELGIDTNTVCRWVRDYRRKNNIPSHAEERDIQVKTRDKSAKKQIQLKELEKENKKLLKQVIEEKEKVEILKKSLHIFMQPQE